MALTEKQKQQRLEYAKRTLKRIPLDVRKEKYAEIAAAAAAAGESVNGYIKAAIDQRMAKEKGVGDASDSDTEHPAAVQ